MSNVADLLAKWEETKDCIEQFNNDIKKKLQEVDTMLVSLLSGGTLLGMDDITPKELWLRPELGLTKEGLYVAAWADQTDFGRGCSQVEGWRPAVVANDINGIDTVGRGGNYLRSGVLSGLDNRTGLSLFSVFKGIVSGGDAIVFTFANNMIGWLYWGGVLSFMFGSHRATVAFANDNPVILTAIYDGTQATDAAKIKVFINGAQQTLGWTSPPIPASVTLTQYGLGAQFEGGGFATGVACHIGEHLLIGKTCDPVEMAVIHTYLSDEWNIALA